MTHVKSVSDVDVSAYVDAQRSVPQSVRESNYQKQLSLIRRLHPVDAQTRILEIGSGTGWFQVMGLRDGLNASHVRNMRGVRGFVLRAAKASSMFKHLLLTFGITTVFVCVK